MFKLSKAGLLLAWLICSVGYADQAAIKITMLKEPKNLAQILHIQEKLTISSNPKELSKQPSATCFETDINQFLPNTVKNPQPIFGCIFSDQVAMNAALLRAGLYVHTDAGMADDVTLFGSKLMTTVGGHDFSGKELAAYMSKAQISMDTKDEYKLLKSIEQSFTTQVIQPIITKNNDNFIFFAVINTKDKFKANLTHELLHAQYYNVTQIAKILESVWQDVPKSDQELIINCLRNGGYDMEQHELLLREFYSYFLQYNAAKYLDGIPVLKPMAPLAKVYAPKIQKALTKHGIKVLDLN